MTPAVPVLDQPRLWNRVPLDEAEESAVGKEYDRKMNLLKNE